MKFKFFSLLFLIVFFSMMGLSFYRLKRLYGGEPWNSSQLMSPNDLAKIIADPKMKQPIIFCIGPGAMVKGSMDMGPAKDSANLAKFKRQLDHLPKDEPIVIYCGCCPFEHCPNIRPAFTLLNQMKFTQHKLLNLEHNLRVDWINKGYPVVH
jgi:thiosulfate/3-mercaptopyruvate sulfurtransferase